MPNCPLHFPTFKYQLLIPIFQIPNSPYITKMKTLSCFMILTILFFSEFAYSTRPEPESSLSKSTNNPKNKGGNGNDAGGGIGGGYFGPGSGFGIPGFGNGIPGGYGAGYGGPNGGYSKGGVIRPSLVCKDKGPCYKKKLTCPAKCFTSYSRSGKGYGGGGGGGGCTMDCKKKCIAYC
ncbi:glycine-rich protein 2-like [Mercurialis annua]|uniref:glycine-rich protein 2-like n=1 Tax=Mercurialis annua TaxID=3986 RepID=UPI00215ECE90|nr:glycine-rich protein 2-like [Mercurialis annua]